jgi:hypothetical protein
MVQEAKSRVKNLARQLCAEGFNSDVKGLTIAVFYITSDSAAENCDGAAG